MAKFKVGDEVKIIAWHGANSHSARKFIGCISRIKRFHLDGYDLEIGTPGAYWTDNELEIVTGKENKFMSIVSKIKELALDADTKLLKKYNVIDEARELTEEGKEVLLQHLFEQNKDAIVAKLKEVDADEKRAKKESK